MVNAFGAKNANGLWKKMNYFDQLFITATPLGKPVETVGIWMSGGADSSLLCYLLAEKIYQQGLDIKIQPITVQKRPGETVAEEVVDFIKFEIADVFKEHIIYRTPDDWQDDEYHGLFRKKHHEHLLNRTYDLIYSGITSNPPVDVQEQIGQEISEDVENIRGESADKRLIFYCSFDRDGELYEEMEVRPFFMMDKQGVSDIYKQRGLLDTLFPITKSCENRNQLQGHCGGCWWCLERKWAFGRL